MHFRLVTGAICATALSLIASTGFAAVPPAGRLDFSVVRDGTVIGHDVLEFAQSGDVLHVNVRTDVQVKIAFVTVYRFTHESQEVWRDGRLESLASRTNDDGTAHELAVHAAANGLEVVGDKRRSTAPGELVPASLWHDGIVRSRVILNTLDGAQMAIQVRDQGLEQVDVQGHPVAAHHYVLTGDLARELWYDAAGVLVQARMKGSDGSDVLYTLR